MQQLSRSKQEALVYLVFWLIMFFVPVISIQFHHADADQFPLHELWAVWRQMGLFLAAFLLHNYLLAPLFVYRQRHLLYFSAITVLVGCFFVVQCMDRPAAGHPQGPHRTFEGQKPPQPHDDAFGPMASGEDLHADFGHDHEAHMKPQEGQPDFGRPPMFIGQHDIISTIMLILMLGMNVGVKLYFKQRDDQRRLERLEKENLEQQLEYLRYQINPHFLMNTLNNIHALVDIDAEQAKATIVELSKIMRFALYEGSKQQVPLSRDIAFLQSYISLMRLRYSSKVAITVDIPADLPETDIPPMLFITFVENAFKHGVSYRQESFIDIRLTIEGRHLLFVCRNSKVAKENLPPKQEGGVGLQNVKKRLQLIYGDNHQLDIADEEGVYTVKLQLTLHN